MVNLRPGRLPDYLVAPNKLHLLPAESLTKAEVSIAVRMDKLEKAMLELAKRPQEAVQELARRPEAVQEEAEQARRSQEGALGLRWREGGPSPTGGC